MIYLGSLLDVSGSMHAELVRRIGAAKAAFRELDVVWRHANISRDRKTRIFEAYVVSRLLYCLHTGWLSEVELRKLDGFHCSCLRRIYGIPHSYVNRISNHELLQ